MRDHAAARTPRRAPVRRPGAPDRARRAGLRRAAARRRADRLGGAAADRPRRRRPDRLGQRARARALPAAVQPPRARTTPTLLDRAAHYAPRRLFEYWGHEASLLPVELQPLLRWRMERAADDAWGGMRRIQRERPELVAQVLDEVRASGPVAASEVLEHERPEADRPVVGLERRQARDRVAVLERPGHVRAPARVRAPLRPARARAARRRCSPRRRRARGGAADAAARRRALARRRDRARPARLLPARRRRGAGARRRAGRGGRAVAGRGRGLARTRATSTPTRGCRGASHARALVGRSTR